MTMKRLLLVISVIGLVSYVLGKLNKPMEYKPLYIDELEAEGEPLLPREERL